MVKQETPETVEGLLPLEHFKSVAFHLLLHTFAEYQRWQGGDGDARTFVDWVRDELPCPHGKTLTVCDECPM
jgi:hypothetical protein